MNEYYWKNRDKELKRKKEYRLANLEKVTIQSKKANHKHYLLNKDKIISRIKTYKIVNKESVKSKRNLQLKDRWKNDKDYVNKSIIRQYSRRKVKKEFCSNCGNTKGLELHHINYLVYNVVCLCKPCHREEHKRLKGD